VGHHQHRLSCVPAFRASQENTMLAEVRNAPLYREWVDHITNVETKDALRYFVGLAAEDSRYMCYPHRKGEVRDFRFEDDQGHQPFAFIVNKGSLLFYFRKPALQSRQWPKELLADHFESLHENGSGELTIKLRSIADVQRLWRLIGVGDASFHSGTTATTQIGYVNPNNQRCAGHRDGLRATRPGCRGGLLLHAWYLLLARTTTDRSSATNCQH
jgi:hypothetical protein